MSTYSDPRSHQPNTYTHHYKTKDNRYVFGTAEQAEAIGAVPTTYEEGEAAGNYWDSLSQPRNPVIK